MKPELIRYINAACEYHQIPPENIFKRTRLHEIVFSRQIYYYFIRKFEGTTFKAIGKQTGFDHATIIHSMRTIENTRQTNKSFAIWLSQTELKLRGDAEKELSGKVRNIVCSIQMRWINAEEAETQITDLVDNFWLNKLEK